MSEIICLSYQTNNNRYILLVDDIGVEEPTTAPECENDESRSRLNSSGSHDQPTAIDADLDASSLGSSVPQNLYTEHLEAAGAHGLEGGELSSTSTPEKLENGA